MSHDILVPLDESPHSATMLPHTAVPAQTSASGVVLRPAAPPPWILEPVGGVSVSGDGMYEAWRRAAPNARVSLAGSAQAFAAQRLRAQTGVLAEGAAQGIRTDAKEHVRLQRIAMAPHGRGSLRRGAPRSVAHKVAHAASQPALQTRPQERNGLLQGPPTRAYRHILVPLRGSPLAERALPPAESLRGSSGGSLVLISAVTRSPGSPAAHFDIDSAALVAYEAELQRLSAHLARVTGQPKRRRVIARPEPAHGHPAEEILAAAERRNVDLIVIVTHGRGGLERLWAVGGAKPAPGAGGAG